MEHDCNDHRETEKTAKKVGATFCLTQKVNER